MMVHQTLLIAAFVVFVVAVFFQPPRTNLIATGLALFALAHLI